MNAIASRVLLLDKDRTNRKILRMAWQIWEHNSQQRSITLIGISEAGEAIARGLASHLRQISNLQLTVLRLELNKRAPNSSPVTLNGAIQDSSLVLVDDVANSGRTLLYALQPLMATAPEKILIAVLVNRKHKSFPVNPDIIGQEVATTLQETIVVTFEDGGILAYLQ